MEWQFLSVYLFLLHSLLPLLQRARTTSCLLCYLRLSHGAWHNIQYKCANSRGRKGGTKGGKWKGEREGWRVRGKREGRKGRKRRRGEQRCSSPGNITFLWACTHSSLSLPSLLPHKVEGSLSNQSVLLTPSHRWRNPPHYWALVMGWPWFRI